MKILEKENKKGERVKILNSSEYNYIFNYTDGNFMRWGKTFNDDPSYSKYGPEILDIEISTICSKKCSFCYKTNTEKGEYMNFETFQELFNMFPKSLTQIAFGLGSIIGNPELYKIMQYCRDNNVVPNITINGEEMNDYHYDMLVKLCGAVAVSCYDDNTCFNAVSELTNRGLKQVNIHKLLAQQTIDECFDLIDKSKTDKRLNKLNAIVFLWLKPKGQRNVFTQVQSFKKYKELVDYAFENSARIGFDSCSAPMFLKAIADRPDYSAIEMLVEPCESTLFSYYINTQGVSYPCSFTEATDDYKGIKLLEQKDFLNDVWYHPETVKFRDKVINNVDCNNCRYCQAFNLEFKGV